MWPEHREGRLQERMLEGTQGPGPSLGGHGEAWKFCEQQGTCSELGFANVTPEGCTGQE